MTPTTLGAEIDVGAAFLYLASLTCESGAVMSVPLATTLSSFPSASKIQSRPTRSEG